MSKSATKPVDSVQTYKPSPEDVKREQEWQARSDVRTLHQAYQIKNDPARFGRARAKMKQHLESLKALMGGGKANPGGDKENAKDAAGPDSELGMPY